MSSPLGHSFVRPAENLWAPLAQVAAGHVGEREESRNRSPFIRRLWIESWPDGADYYEGREPWCAAFVSWCIIAACARDSRLSRPKVLSPSVAQIVEAWKRSDTIRIVPWREARAGDVITFRPVFSHIGIVESRDSAGIVTIEGNTNGASEREGDGVYRKHRATDLVTRCDVWRLASVDPMRLRAAPIDMTPTEARDFRAKMESIPGQ